MTADTPPADWARHVQDVIARDGCLSWRPAGEAVRAPLPGGAERAARLGWEAAERGDDAHAERLLRHALSLRPDLPQALYPLALVLGRTGRVPEALDALERCDALFPGGPARDAHAELAKAAGVREGKAWPLPRERLWDGGGVKGRRVLLVADAYLGVGDVVQFVRGSVPLRALGAHVTLSCPGRLHRLLRTCPGLDALRYDHPGASDYDVWVPLRVLPGRFGEEAESFPYLSAEPERVERWRAELAGHGGLRIGINWSGARWGNPAPARAVPLAEFGAVSRVGGVTLFALQQGFGREEMAGAGFPLVDLAPRLDAEGAFLDTAAVMQSLDLVITSDTSAGHVGGALGAPVWVLLPPNPCPRWRDGGEATHLYPSMRLFRSARVADPVGPRPADWAALFRRVAAEVKRVRTERGY